MICWLWWHRWSKWGEVQRHVYTRTYDEIGGVLVPLPIPLKVTRDEQSRSCIKCGITETRRVQ